MIVRINQIELANAEPDAGWAGGTLASGFTHGWPTSTRVFELLILSEDEKKQPLTDAFRRQQLRQMLPQTAIALRSPGEHVIARFDGPVAGKELLPAWRHLTESDGAGRFCFSSVMRAEDPAATVIGSVRTAPSWKALCAIAADADLGLESAVRARLFLAPEELAPLLLETADPDDAAWEALLAECSFLIGTTMGLRSLLIFSRTLDAVQVKQKIMQRLMSVARGESANPD